MTEPSSKPRPIRSLDCLCLFIVSLALVVTGDAITNHWPPVMQTGQTSLLIFFILGEALFPFIVGAIFMFWRKSVAAGYIAVLVCIFLSFAAPIIKSI